MNNITSNYAKQRWGSLWSFYIKTSKRGSSSAMTTADAFIKLGKIGEGSRVLDLGCGHGRITELLVQRVPSLDIVGVDMTQELLDRFLVKQGDNGCKLKLVCANIYHLPLEDASFDAVVSSRVFQYLPDPRVGVREALRVLRPGGALVIAVPNKINPIKYVTYTEPLYSPFQVRDWFKESGFAEVKSGSMCFLPTSSRFKRLASVVELAAGIPFIKFFGGNALVKGKKRA